MAEIILLGGAVGGLVLTGLLQFLLARSGRIRLALLVCGVFLALIVAIIALSAGRATFEDRLLMNLNLFWAVPALFGALLGLIFGRHSYRIRTGQLPHG